LERCKTAETALELITDFNHAMMSLDCETLYYVRAYATNSAGTAYGNQVSFSTGVCPSTDHLEPNNSFDQAYNLGTTIDYYDSKLYLTIGDEDWFRFEYNSKQYYLKISGSDPSGDEGAYGLDFHSFDGTLIVETFYYDGNTDTRIDIYDSDHTTRIGFDDDSGDSPFSKITISLN